jgi:hypothetical protein
MHATGVLNFLSGTCKTMYNEIDGCIIALLNMLIKM